jgi:SAM-dependent methyltransferase
MRSEDLNRLSAPSKTLISFAAEMQTNLELPLLDVGCGYGRNAVALAARGSSVVCVDKELERLHTLVRLSPKYIEDQNQSKHEVGHLYPLLADLDPSRWPFRKNCFAGIICVHFLDVSFFNVFYYSLVTRGCLFIETFGGQGGNYLDLPKAGYLHDLLIENFDFHFYQERKVGPVGHDSVAVRLLARKRPSETH